MLKKVKSTLILLLTAIIWGFAFVAQAQGAKYMGALTFNGVRFLLGALSLIPVFLIFEKGKTERGTGKRTMIYGAVAGALLFAASTLQQYGIELSQAPGKAAFITSLYTVLVPIFAIFLKKKTSTGTWLGAGLALCGLYLLCIRDAFMLEPGDLPVLIGAFFWAFHILFIDKFVASVRPIRFACMQFATCSALSLIPSAFLEQSSYSLSAFTAAAVPIIYGGVFSAGVAYTCQIIGQRDADPTFAAIVLSTESVFSAVGEMLVLGVFMSARSYVGCAVIFTGILLSQLWGFKGRKSRNN